MKRAGAKTLSPTTGRGRVSAGVMIALLLVFTSICTSCAWQLRNPSEVPSQLKPLYFDPKNLESHFTVQLLNLFKSMRIPLVKTPDAAPLILHVYNYSLKHNNPSLSSTNVAITYTYTLTVTVSLTDAQGRVVVSPRTIVTSHDITVNTNQIFTINSTSVFQQDLQREAVNLIYYWLTCDQTRKLLIAARQQHRTLHATQPTALIPAP